jgi:hypothetical protein
VLCCAVLYYVVLCCVVLCCVVLCCAVLCCVVLSCLVLSCLVFFVLSCLHLCLGLVSVLRLHWPTIHTCVVLSGLAFTRLSLPVIGCPALPSLTCGHFGQLFRWPIYLVFSLALPFLTLQNIRTLPFLPMNGLLSFCGASHCILSRILTLVFWHLENQGLRTHKDIKGER